MIIGLLTVLHLAVCVFLILVVLLQTGKGADLAGAFGTGGSQTAFGARGATTLLAKLTTGSAIIFMITSFTLALMGSRGGTSVVTDEPTQQSAPAVPAPSPVPPAESAPAAPSEPAPAPPDQTPPPGGQH